MKRSITVLSLAAGLALSLAALAIASHGVIRDPSGDVSGNPQGRRADFDLIKASFGHGRDGRLAHTASVRGKVGDPSSRTGAPVPRLDIEIPGKHGPNPNCDYFVTSTPPSGPNGNWGGAVFPCSNGPTPPSTGRARITKVDDNRIRYSFRRRAIGNPERYRFDFAFGGEGDVEFDRIPDKGFAVHNLR